MRYLIVFCLISLSFSQAVISIPPEKQVVQVFIRIGEHKQVTVPPTFPFRTIYSQEVYELYDNNKERDFSSVCQQVPANIIFNSTFESKLDIYQTSVTKDVVTTFQEIKANRMILDSALYNDKAYLFLKDNKLSVFDTKNNNSSWNQSMPSLAQKRSIETGFFVEVDSKLFIITRYEAFLIKGNEIISRIQGYEQFLQLQSARDLFGTYFAICGINSGVIIYSYQNNKLVKKLTLDAQFFGREAIFISDLAYNADKKQVFISDLKFGINIVNLQQQNNEIKATLQSKGYRKTGCNVIVFSQGYLYASCDDLFKIRYSFDQGIITLPNPMFRVKQILVYKELIVVVGEDLISKYYNDKVTEDTPQFDTTERLIFYSNNRYLVANYYGIQAGTFQIRYPSVECYTHEQSHQATINAVIKIKAECSNTYFQKYNVSITQAPQKYDTCLYTSPVRFVFWKSEKFDMEIIFVIFGILFLVAAIIVIWCIFIYKKQAHLKRTLEMYTNPNSFDLVTSTQIPSYAVLIEDNKEGNDVSETQKGLQIEKETHSID